MALIDILILALGLVVYCVIMVYLHYRNKWLRKDNNEWKYHECKQCYICFPHMSVPEICVCGNDMKKNYNKKTLKLIKFANCVEGDVQ